VPFNSGGQSAIKAAVSANGNTTVVNTPVFVPKDTWEVFKELAKRMTTVPNPNYIAWQFFNSHPELVTIAIAAGVSGIIISVGGTAGSWGAASPATIPLAISCGVICYIAFNFDSNNPPPSNS
jgi:hypothetical protein